MDCTPAHYLTEFPAVAEFTGQRIPRSLMAASRLADIGLFRLMGMFLGIYSLQITSAFNQRLSKPELDALIQLSYDARTYRTISAEMKGFPSSLNQTTPEPCSHPVVIVTVDQVEKAPVQVGLSEQEWKEKWIKNQNQLAQEWNEEPIDVIVESNLTHMELCLSDSVLEAIQRVLDINTIKVTVAIPSQSI